MSKAFDAAVLLLTRREHGEDELRKKLANKGYAEDACNEALKACQRLGLQSDPRYAEALCNRRVRQGYGPLRIKQELQAKRIDDDTINAVLTIYHGEWLAYALTAWQKKFKHPALCRSEQQKHLRFLQYRGFSTETIAQLFKNGSCHE